MSITGFFVLFAVTWFLCLWVMLPIGLRTQEDENDVVAGTQSGAPANLNFGRKIKMVTIVATLIWIVMISAIYFSGITIADLDLFNVLGER